MDLTIQQGDLAGAVAPMAESLSLARRLAELAPDPIPTHRAVTLGWSEAESKVDYGPIDRLLRRFGTEVHASRAFGSARHATDPR